VRALFRSKNRYVVVAALKLAMFPQWRGERAGQHLRGEAFCTAAVERIAIRSTGSAQRGLRGWRGCGQVTPAKPSL